MNKNQIVNYSMYAKQRRELDLDIVFDKPQNISPLIDNKKTIIKASFSFFEENSSSNIKFSLTGSIPLICQNTLEVFDFAFSSDGVVAVVEDDRLLKNDLYEPFICAEDTVDLKDIVSEEILLTLPVVPKKDGGPCKVEHKPSYYSENENPVKKKENPFSILKDLKF